MSKKPLLRTDGCTDLPERLPRACARYFQENLQELGRTTLRRHTATEIGIIRTAWMPTGEGVLARDPATGYFEIIDDDELQAIVDSRRTRTLVDFSSPILQFCAMGGPRAYRLHHTTL